MHWRRKVREIPSQARTSSVEHQRARDPIVTAPLRRCDARSYPDELARLGWQEGM